MNTKSSTRPKRHWSSIRLLYVLVAITAVGFVFGQWITPAMTQQKQVSQIRGDGGWTLHGNEGDSVPNPVLKYFFPPEALIPIHTVSFGNSRSEIPSRSIRTVRGMPAVSHLFLRGRIVSTDVLTEIMKLDNLDTLDLSGTTVDDETLQLLSQHPSLQRILLTGSKVTKSGVETFVANSDITVSYWFDLKARFYQDGKPVQPPLAFGETYEYELSLYRTERNYIGSKIWISFFNRNGVAYIKYPERVSRRAVNDPSHREIFESGSITLIKERPPSDTLPIPSKILLQFHTSHGTIDVPIKFPVNNAEGE